MSTAGSLWTYLSNRGTTLADRLHEITTRMATDQDSELSTLFHAASTPQRKALLDALADAYDAGQEAADRRTGRFVSMVIGPLLGIEPSSDPIQLFGNVKRLKSLRDAVGRIAGRRTE